MNTTLSLVQTLREMTPSAQESLLAIRLSTVTGLRDWFDVADALLTTTSIDRGLARLRRNELVELVGGNVSDVGNAHLKELALGDGSAAFAETIARASAIAFDNSEPPTDALATIDERYERAALEQATAMVTRIDELLELMAVRGLRTVSRGSISSADATRVAAAIPDLPADLSGLLHLMRGAELVELSNGLWSVATTNPWSNAGTAERWSLLAQGWRASLTPAILDALTERADWADALTAYLQWLFPVDPEVVLSQSTVALTQADALGLRVNGSRTTVGAEIALGNLPAATARVSALLPSYIEKVMVQSDLTIVAPGPLRPEIESKLRRIATVESRSIASTYRLSAPLISRAMDHGLSATEIEGFLGDISSTGIPQPVAYLISDVGTKHASIRVRSEGRGTLITCSDAALAKRLHADFALKALGLTVETELSLSSPHDVSVVMRNLLGEKYPAALENETGEIQPWEPAPATPTGSTSVVNAISALVERLNASAAPVNEGDDQWLVRQIEVAIRNRTLVNVTVALPDGSSRDFLIDPRGLSNGRFRGLDRKSEVERTLPLASITAITPAEVA